MAARTPERTDHLVALALGAATFALYLRTLAPGLLFGDPGEFQFAVPTLGLVHPTGYPLYTLLGWLWSHLLPFHDPAWRMNAFSALWGGVAVGLTYLVAGRCVALAAGLEVWPRRFTALFSALLFALSGLLWSQAVVAEVYTLHLAFVALILWLTLDVSGMWNSGRWLLLAFIFGLSLTHHRTTLLLAPALLVPLWTAARRSLNRSKLWQAALLVLTPLLLYAYIPWRGGQSPYLHIRLAPDRLLHVYQNTVSGFLRWTFGTDFAGELRSVSAAWGQLPYAGRLLASEVPPMLLAVAAVGIIALIVRGHWRLLALTGLYFLAQLVFNLFYGIGDVIVLYTPLIFIVSLWAGVGLAVLLSLLHLPRFTATWERTLTAVVLILAIAFPLWKGARVMPLVDRSQDRSAREMWETLLAASPPEDAILVSNDRDEMTPIFYLQQVDGRGRALAGFFPLITPDPAWQDIGTTVETLLAGSRPVYLIKAMDGLAVKFTLEPAGALTHITGSTADQEPQHPTDVSFGDEMRLVGYDVQLASLASDGMIQVTLYWQAAQPLSEDYTTFVQLLDTSEQKVAQNDHVPGGVYYPTSLWKTGEALRDIHFLKVADSTLSDRYRILVGLYRFPSLRHLGTPTIIGEVVMQ